MVLKNADRAFKKNSSNQSVFFIICLILAAANLFRTPFWSADVIEYQAAYDVITSSNIDSLEDFIRLSFEPGFVILSIVTGYFTTSVNLVLFLFAIVSLYIKLIYIQSRYVRSGTLLIVLYAFTYYILLELTQSRIAIASAIIMIAYHFLIREMVGKFILAVIFATLFHYTALVALLALVFYKQDRDDLITRNLIVFGILLGASVAFRSSAIFDLILLFDAKKASYLTDADVDLGSSVFRMAIVFVYQGLILMVTFPNALRTTNEKILKFHALLFNLYLASISIYLTLHSFGVVAVRLAEVFRNVEPFLLAISFSYCSNKKKPILLAVIFLSICVNLQKNSLALFPEG